MNNSKNKCNIDLIIYNNNNTNISNVSGIDTD